MAIRWVTKGAGRGRGCEEVDVHITAEQKAPLAYIRISKHTYENVFKRAENIKVGFDGRKCYLIADPSGYKVGVLRNGCAIFNVGEKSIQPEASLDSFAGDYKLKQDPDTKFYYFVIGEGIQERMEV